MFRANRLIFRRRLKSFSHWCKSVLSLDYLEGVGGVWVAVHGTVINLRAESPFLR